MTITLNNLQNDAFLSQSKTLEKADTEGPSPFEISQNVVIRSCRIFPEQDLLPCSSDEQVYF